MHNPEFWVLVAFLIFFGLFGTRLWSTITGMLDARAASVRTELEEAAKLRAEAEQMLKDAQAEREAALATQAARKVIAATLSAEDDAALVDEAIGGLPRALRAA
jgi:F0F1-type ATP synthase membrane subunit b/b'